MIRHEDPKKQAAFESALADAAAALSTKSFLLPLDAQGYPMIRTKPDGSESTIEAFADAEILRENCPAPRWRPVEFRALLTLALAHPRATWLRIHERLLTIRSRAKTSPRCSMS